MKSHLDFPYSIKKALLKQCFFLYGNIPIIVFVYF